MVCVCSSRVGVLLNGCNGFAASAHALNNGAESLHKELNALHTRLTGDDLHVFKGNTDIQQQHHYRQLPGLW